MDLFRNNTEHHYAVWSAFDWDMLLTVSVVAEIEKKKKKKMCMIISVSMSMGCILNGRMNALSPMQI